MANSNSTLTIEELKRLFHYDSETGIFTRLACADRSHIGDIMSSLDDWGYIKFRVKGRKYRAHVLAWFYVYGVWPTNQIDHKDTIKIHNWIDNLRDVTQSINQQNRKVSRVDSKTGILGVSPNRGKFKAQIVVSGKKISLGNFNTAELASAAYQEAKERLHPGRIS